jgi:hypothetical protein
MTSKSKKLNVQLINVDHTAAQQLELLQSLESKEIDILVIPEPYLKDNKITNVPTAYSTLIQDRIAVLYNSKLNVNVVKLEKFLIIVEVGTALLCCAHLSPNEPIESKLNIIHNTIEKQKQGPQRDWTDR